MSTMSSTDVEGPYSRGMRPDDASFIKSTKRPAPSRKGRELVAVDLFAGCGGLSIGLWEAARRAGVRLRVPLAVDTDPLMVATFRRNLPSAGALAGRVEEWFPGEPGSALSPGEARLARAIGPVHVLCGGPPCQGHSDLNNHTRRRDDRNQLYLRMARAAEALLPEVVVVENVPAVQLDAAKVVDETARQLEKLGYEVGAQIVDLAVVGVPQRRRRHLMIATSAIGLTPTDVFNDITVCSDSRTVEWAIEDLAGMDGERSLIDTPSRATATNKRRMKYLFDHDLYELPDSQRPPCHRDKAHSYRSVYGRMKWDGPAPTITTGFGSMGQGRFVHPSEQRTITPHEAARLQTFPDWFDWGTDTRRGLIATMIGNAVPPLLTVRLGELLIPYLSTD